MGTPRSDRRAEAGFQTLSYPSIALRLHGRRKGRPLRARKSLLIKNLLPLLQIVLPDKRQINPKELFKNNPVAIWLEIGFGNGEHLAAQARNNPGIGFIGCEPFVNGIAGLLGLIDKHKISNIRIFPDNARTLIDAMPDACIDRCLVLFADTWPKVRHAKRRFICP
jgi:tRNA (guanine-N7-)-methyltransferase